MIKKPTGEELKGMTVNERLFVCNVLGDFEVAAKKRNKERMIEILTGVKFTSDQATWTTEKILENPQKYGY
jgi:hypothetical protein